MATYLTALPENLGYVNLGTVQAYPTGGTGPTAYGPTSYFGSDPLPSRPGDSINNPINLGDYSSIFKTLTINNTHGGLSRINTTFFTFYLLRPRAVQFVQNYSTTAYTSNTNRNTILSIYKVEDGTHRRELPINNNGFVYTTTGIPDNDNDTISTGNDSNYPNITMPVGRYLFLITNDIRYLETTYSINLGLSLVDWRFVIEDPEESIDFGFVVDGSEETIDFGFIS